jgi:hypothetical protein
MTDRTDHQPSMEEILRRIREQYAEEQKRASELSLMRPRNPPSVNIV